MTTTVKDVNMNSSVNFLVLALLCLVLSSELQMGQSVVHALDSSADFKAESVSGWVRTGRIQNLQYVSEPEEAIRLTTHKDRTQGSINFTHEDSAGLTSEAFQKGWTMMATLRLDTEAQTPFQRNGAVLLVEAVENQKSFVVNFCTREDTGEMYLLINRKQIPLPNISPEKFNTFEISYTPDSDTATVRVNGEEVAEGLQPSGLERSAGSELRDRILWGHRSTMSPAVSEWKEVRFEIPEPGQ